MAVYNTFLLQVWGSRAYYLCRESISKEAPETQTAPSNRDGAESNGTGQGDRREADTTKSSPRKTASGKTGRGQGEKPSRDC